MYMILYRIYKFILNMINVLVIEKYESYRNNLVEYFELFGFNVFSLDQCSSFFYTLSEKGFHLIVCDFDQEIDFGLKDFKRFINLERINSSNIFLLTTKIKKASDLFDLGICHDQIYVIEGKGLKDISIMMKKLGVI